MPTRTFTILTSSPSPTTPPSPSSSEPSKPSIQISIHEPAAARRNLGDSTWSSSTVLANRLHLISLPPSPQPASTTAQAPLHNILEVGAGTGLVGISAAALWPSTSVLLTDFPSVVPNLAANIALNAPTLAAAGSTARAGSLDWMQPGQLDIHDPNTPDAPATPPPPKFRTILAADIIYDPDHPELVSRVVFTWLERSREARFCIAWPLRVAYLDHIRELWGMLEDGGLVCEGEGREEVGREWDDERLIEWSVWRWGPA